VYALAQGGGRLGFAAQSWGSGMSYGEFGAWTGYYGATSGPFAYVYTDRPLYRPGQEVQFKGILRQGDDLHYSLPAERSVQVRITSMEEEVYNESLNVSASGSFEGTFGVAEDAEVGTYDLQVYLTPDQPFGFVSFRVAEYRKPEFQITASAPEADVLVGGEIPFKVQADYYSGGSLQRAGVSWFTEASPYTFHPSEKYFNFSFTDYGFDWYQASAGQPAGGTLNQGEGTTDETGQFTVVQPAVLSKDNISRRVSFNANGERECQRGRASEPDLCRDPSSPVPGRGGRAAAVRGGGARLALESAGWPQRERRCLQRGVAQHSEAG
jgi:uncharacterized protein YfaS (alpha-2-macroglobulin family)